MFGQRKRLRALAARMLLVWLFALTAGIVNACVVEPGSGHAMPSMAGEHHHSGMSPDQGDAHGQAHHQRAPGLDKGSCLKFCSDEASSVVSTQQPLDPGLVLGLGVLPAPVLWADRDGDGIRSARADARPPPERVPIQIAFVRLTL